MYWTLHKGSNGQWEGIFSPYNERVYEGDILFLTGWEGIKEEAKEEQLLDEDENDTSEIEHDSNQ